MIVIYNTYENIDLILFISLLNYSLRIKLDNTVVFHTLAVQWSHMSGSTKQLKLWLARCTVISQS
jgi:hypothetical protein